MKVEKKAKKKSDKVRINFTMAREIKEFLDEEASKNGVPLSAYITMLIQQSRQQSDSLKTLADVIVKLNESETKK
jgi:hypothetical protein